MLKKLINARPKNLLAVYVESQHIEVLRAHRQWRTWRIDSAEHFALHEGESVFEGLQRLNLKPRNRKSTALVLFLPRNHYSFHREFYPAGLQDQLDQALEFDWQENVFQEHERTLNFFGQATPLDQQLSVPIFSLPQETYDKFHQALGGTLFQTFTVLPSSLVYAAFLPLLPTGEEASPLQIIGRVLNANQIEVHRFYEGRLLDSILVRRKKEHLRLFIENLPHIEDDDGEGITPVHVIFTDRDGPGSLEDERIWEEEGLPLKPFRINGPLISSWVNHLLVQDHIQTFDAKLLLKPWTIPKVIYPVAAALFVFFAFGLYQSYSSKQMLAASQQLRKQELQLATEWKPIEELQTRIAKFHEDKKTLSAFSAEGYPLIELMTLLTEVTPPDTWLNYLSVRKGQIMLRGESKSAIKYLSELSKIEGFSDVRFASPVNRNPSTNMERFNVQFQVDMDRLKGSLDNIAIYAPGESPSSTQPVTGTTGLELPLNKPDQGTVTGAPQEDTSTDLQQEEPTELTPEEEEELRALEEEMNEEPEEEVEQ